MYKWIGKGKSKKKTVDTNGESMCFLIKLIRLSIS